MTSQEIKDVLIEDFFGTDDSPVVEEDPNLFFKRDKNSFELRDCPHCGMGNASMIQTPGKPTFVVCLYCKRKIYAIEIKETYFDSVIEPVMRKFDRFRQEQEHKKEMEEINALKERTPCGEVNMEKLDSSVEEKN